MPAPASLERIIAQLRTSWMDDFDHGEHRDWSGQSTITYMPVSTPVTAWGVPAEFWGVTPMTPFELANMRLAFELWDDLVAVDLTEISSGDPDISFGRSTTTTGGGTYADLDEELFGTHLTNAEVWINAGTGAPSDARLFFGGGEFNTYLHEIGHALGLSHPGRYNGGDADPDWYRSDAEYAQDTSQYTVMSYFDAGADGSATSHVASDGWLRLGATPLLHDIAAIQAIYGADMTTRTGNTVYGFNSNAGRTIDGWRLNPYDFAQNPDPIFAIWDAGGIDTIDASGFMTNQTIRLGAGEFSSIGALTNNIAVAFGATIENAIGGSGDDTITGNEANNRLEGGGGNDNLLAGTGVDTLIGGSGRDTLWGAGNDILAGGADNDLYYVTVGDRVSEAADGGFDTVETELATYTMHSHVDRLVFTNAEFDPTGAHRGNGNWTANTMIGAGGRDTLDALGGDDTLWGRGGDDTLNGGSDHDTLYGEAGVDTLVGERGDDTLYGGNENDTLDGGSDHDTLYGEAGVDILRGGYGNDRLFGGSENDTLNGGADQDTLVGGAGRDTLTGALGADTFRFVDVTFDTVTDFEHGVDRLDVSMIDANGSLLDGDQAFTFLANPAKHVGSWVGMLWVTGGTSSGFTPGGFPGGFLGGGGPGFPLMPTTVYGSTDADPEAEFQITLQLNPAVTAADFIL